MLAAVIALPLLLATAVAALSLLNRPGPEGPLAVPAVPAPAAGSAECSALVVALPRRLQSGATQLERRTLASPAPQGTAAWGAQRPAVLRCGLDRPAELTRTAQLLEISGVRWLTLAGEGQSTWVAVDRPVYVALTLPDGAGTGPLQGVSSAIVASLPSRPVQPAE